MPASYIYKAQGERGKLGIFLTPQEDQRSQPFAVLSDGRRIPGQYVNTNEGRHQYLFGDDILGQTGVKIEYNGKTIDLEDSNKSYEGNNPYDGWTYRNKGDLGSGGGAGGGGQFAPGQAGQYGFFPAYQNYPDPFLLDGNYNVNQIPYKFVDPFKFSQEYGDLARSEAGKNLQFSKDMAMEELDAELQGLYKYVPGAAALKRQETSLDNEFNQQQRTSQIDSALPGVRNQLKAQGQRAETYASGNLPDSQQNAALELGIRSRSADQSTFGGFGARSSVARKASDLMSAEERFKIAQYGEQALTSNIGNRANLELAPTEYSNAGQQINVMPSISGSQLTAQNFQELNNLSILPASTAFQGAVNQNQFESSQEYNRQTFNAQMGFNKDSFNVKTQNDFALGKFDYDVGYAGTVAGAYLQNSNTQFGLDQQKRFEQIFADYLNQAKASGNYQAIAGIIGAIIPNAADIITSIFGGGGGGGGGSSAGGSIGSGADVSGGGSAGEVGDSSGAGSAGDAGDSSGDASGAGSVGEVSSSPQPPYESGPDGSGNLDPETPEVASAKLRSFTADTGVKLGRATPAQAKAMTNQANSVLRSTGVYNVPGPNRVEAGVNSAGQKVYMDTRLANSTDQTLGGKQASMVKSVLDPLGVFDNPSSNAWDKIGVVADDAGFALQLTDLQKRGDKAGFINAILQQYKQPLLNQISKNPDDNARVGASAALSAYNLFQNWDRMSPGQKSIGLASVGIQSYKFSSGIDLAKEPIPGTQIKGYPELTVGQALQFMSAGINAYTLVDNWKDLNDIEKVVYGTQNAVNVAQVAQNLHLLQGGSSAAGAGASAISSGASALSGGSAAGAGAAGNVGGAAGAGAAGEVGGLSTLSTVAGGLQIAAGAYQIYQGWGQGGAKGRTNAAIGGGSIVAGLYTLGYSNPYTAAAIIAISVVGGSIKTGKHIDQKARDATRGRLQQVGLTDKEHNVTLANGSKFNLGVDGNGGIHSVTNKDLLSNAQRGKVSKLNAYDIDYTNDLDYSAGMGGIALSRLVSGGTGKNIDQLGNQLGNAALGDVGYGKEFNRGSYAKVQANLRSFYSQSGIKTKADGFALAAAAHKEGRLSDVDLVTTQQALNMVFDDKGFDTAAKLMAGRQRGIEVAESDKDKGDRPINSYPPVELPKVPKGNELQIVGPKAPLTGGINYRTGRLTKEQIKQANRQRYGSGSSPYSIQSRA